MDIPSKTMNELRNCANGLADIARPIALQYFRSSNLEIDNKLDQGFDPVTIADRAIEKAMREYLDNARPEDGVLGEEYENKQSLSGLTWVLDPIDGTKGFMSGTPTWGVLIALNAGQAPVLGIIDQPFTGERFEGGPEWAEWHHNGTTKPIKTRQTSKLSDAVLFTTYPEIGSLEEGNAFKSVSENCKLTRYGTDCYAYALLAAGQIDLVIEAGLNPYDIQGPQAVVEAAGGIVTDWSGGDAHNGGQVIAAANAEIHAEALIHLKSGLNS